MFGPNFEFKVDADVRAGHFAGLDKLPRDEHEHVRGDGEADSFVVARIAGDAGVDADHFALQVDQRPAAVAGIDGGVGLQEILDHVLFRLSLLAEFQISPALCR